MKPLPYIGILPAAGVAERLAPFRYAKELLPITYIAEPETGQLRPLPVIEFSIQALSIATIERCIVIVSDRKPEIPRYLSNAELDLEIAYVYQSAPVGLAAAVALAAPWTHNCNSCLLLPDTIVRPREALRTTCELFSSEKADLALGIFPTSRPRELGPVRFDSDMRVVEVLDKPETTDLLNTWAIAVWSPAFTELLCNALASPASAGEPLGMIFNRAVKLGMRVVAAWFPDGRFDDLGTPRGLTDAIQK